MATRYQRVSTDEPEKRDTAGSVLPEETRAWYERLFRNRSTNYRAFRESRERRRALLSARRQSKKADHGQYDGDEDAVGGDSHVYLRWNGIRWEAEGLVVAAVVIFVSLFCLVSVIIFCGAFRRVEQFKYYPHANATSLNQPEMRPWSVIDAVYFTVTSFLGDGFGDVVPVSSAGRLYTAVLHFASVAAAGCVVGAMLSDMVRTQVNRRYHVLTTSRRVFAGAVWRHHHHHHHQQHLGRGDNGEVAAGRSDKRDSRDGFLSPESEPLLPSTQILSGAAAEAASGGGGGSGGSSSVGSGSGNGNLKVALERSHARVRQWKEDAWGTGVQVAVAAPALALLIVGGAVALWLALVTGSKLKGAAKALSIGFGVTSSKSDDADDEWGGEGGRSEKRLSASRLAGLIEPPGFMVYLFACSSARLTYGDAWFPTDWVGKVATCVVCAVLCAAHSAFTVTVATLLMTRFYYPEGASEHTLRLIEEAQAHNSDQKAAAAANAAAAVVHRKSKQSRRRRRRLTGASGATSDGGGAVAAGGHGDNDNDDDGGDGGGGDKSHEDEDRRLSSSSSSAFLSLQFKKRASAYVLDGITREQQQQRPGSPLAAPPSRLRWARLSGSSVGSGKSVDSGGGGHDGAHDGNAGKSDLEAGSRGAAGSSTEFTSNGGGGQSGGQGGQSSPPSSPSSSFFLPPRMSSPLKGRGMNSSPSKVRGGATATTMGVVEERG
eukprot:CAMPEP_0171689000 /NCGR_PEP_ID=MMETSP0991-20121206/4207_1 /TAXON_ID=483369 /ORGANISM="non described non described, Strain CCMP2098" /LENGTH=716 /DNA_ID=CAMNT_0012277003 /DNA_START=17 /DNA_END=2163 /DNA_ORIENTATION=-